MSTVELLGWAGTITTVILGLPQLLRLARTRSVEGLSLTAWQAFLAVNVGWTAHGLYIGQAPLALASAAALLSTVPILVLMSRQLRRNVLLTLAPGLIGGAIMIIVDQLFGSGAYGAVAIIPAVIANAGQTVALIRDRHVRGVSLLFLVLAVATQAIWFVWGTLIGDVGTVIGATTTGAIALINLSWYSARRLGLPPLGHRRPAISA